MQQTLTQGKVSNHLIKLTIPMIWGVFSLVAFSVIDTYFVGQLGTQSLAAMSFTFPVVMTLGSLAMGLGIGASSVIALAIGKGDRSSVRRLTTDSLTLSLLIVVVFVLAGLLSIDPLFTLLGAGEELLPLIHNYMETWYWGMMFLVVPMVGNNVIRASGNTLVPSIIMTVAAVVNLVLDPVLIFGWWGFPRLELTGAALATVISRIVTLVAALWFLHFRLEMLCFNLPKPATVIKSWSQILKIGLPAAATNMIHPISIGFITGLVSVYGVTAVAGFGIASRIEALALIMLMALSGSVSPFVGQNWGAKQYSRVRQAIYQCFAFCLFWGVLTALILAGMGGKIAAGFDPNPQVIAVVSKYLKIVPFSYAAYGIILVASATFNALLEPLPSVVMMILRMFVLYVPLAYLGSYLLGLQGIFLAGCLANILVGVASYWWTKKTCSIHQTEPADSLIPSNKLMTED